MNNFKPAWKGNNSRSAGGASRFNTSGGRKFNGDRRGFGGKTRFRSSFIDESKFISKADDTVQADVYNDSALSFAELNLHTKLKQNITARGYTKLTKIQAEVITPLLEKKDVIGLARTGSGKTAAFLIPAINKALTNLNERTLIVVPTRELANQIQAEIRLLVMGTNILDVVIVGGASYSTQIRVLRKNPQFVIATPGRLLDLAKNKQINLSNYGTVVLDEVDTMLDMGFLPSIKEVVAGLKSPRQSMFFSATLEAKIKDLAFSMMVEPVIIQTDTQSSIKNVHQDVVRIGSGSKIETLHKLLTDVAFRKVLVFSRTKHGVDDIVDGLRKKGHRADALHGNKSLQARTKVLAMFKRDEIKILVATDVASRGIDVPDISHVINYDRPATYHDYIHRVGRTGRIGKKGVALTFV